MRVIFKTFLTSSQIEEIERASKLLVSYVRIILYDLPYDICNTTSYYSNGGIRYCRSHCRQSSNKNAVLIDDDDIDDDKNIAR